MTKTEQRIQFLRNISKLIAIAAGIGIDVICSTFHRTPEVQAEMVKKKLSRTQHSKHLDWLAMDLVIVKNGEAVWEFIPEYTQLGSLWEVSFGGTWGGRWKDPVDPYHFEIGKEQNEKI